MRLLGVACLIVGGLVLSLLTMTRVHAWGDELRLWVEAVQQSPDKPRPWVNLGNMYANRGATSIAIWAYQTAAEKASAPTRSRDEQIVGRALAEANVAVLRHQQGDRAGALQMVDAIVARSPLASVVALQAWMRRTG